MKQLTKLAKLILLISRCKAWILSLKTVRILLRKNLRYFDLCKPLPAELTTDFEAYLCVTHNIIERFPVTDNLKKLSDRFKTNSIRTDSDQKSKLYKVRRFVFKYYPFWLAFNVLRLFVNFVIAVLPIDDEQFLICIGDFFQFVGGKRFFANFFLASMFTISLAAVCKLRYCKNPNHYQWLVLWLTLNGKSNTSFAKIGIRSRKDALRLIRLSSLLSLVSWSLFALGWFSSMAFYIYISFFNYGLQNLLLFGIPFLFVNLTFIFLITSSFLLQLITILICCEYIILRYQNCRRQLKLIFESHSSQRQKTFKMSQILHECTEITNLFESYNHFYSTVFGLIHFLLPICIVLVLYFILFVDLSTFMLSMYIMGILYSFVFYSIPTLVVARIPKLMAEFYSDWSSAILQISDSNLAFRVISFITNF